MSFPVIFGTFCTILCLYYVVFTLWSSFYDKFSVSFPSRLPIVCLWLDVHCALILWDFFSFSVNKTVIFKVFLKAFIHSGFPGRKPLFLQDVAQWHTFTPGAAQQAHSHLLATEQLHRSGWGWWPCSVVLMREGQALLFPLLPLWDDNQSVSFWPLSIIPALPLL